jgi:hypothetical protein
MACATGGAGGAMSGPFGAGITIEEPGYPVPGASGMSVSDWGATRLRSWSGVCADVCAKTCGNAKTDAATARIAVMAHRQNTLTGRPICRPAIVFFSVAIAAISSRRGTLRNAQGD